MSPLVSPAVLSLEENSRELYLEATSILLRLATNVIKHPLDPKYRSIRLSNPTISSKLLSAIGARKCLQEMGFVETGECLILPDDSNLETLKHVHDQIMARRNKISMETNQPSKSGAIDDSCKHAVQDASGSSSITPWTSASTPPPTSVCVSTSAPTSASTSISTSASAKDHTPPKACDVNGVLRGVEPQSPERKTTQKFSKQGFLERIVSASEGVAQNHKKDLLDFAKSHIPLNDLEIAALEHLRKIQKELKRDQADKRDSVLVEPSMQELLLLQLLSWFKNKFFSWMNNPSCKFCTGKTRFRRTDLRDDFLVEVYECAICLQETDFTRYYDPIKLLETRCGRCGEWGRCFTFLCCSLGWDARLVIDETDHVWTEVYLVSQSKWIHCDPCENACDTPLMYERGWKKKLSYILAYTFDDVQDVTWRYSSNHKEVLKRRNYCTEAQLLETIMNQRKLRQQTLSPSRKAYLLKRTLFELVELWKEPLEKDEVYQGRQSGSLAWRLARGETAVSPQRFVWKPNQSEIKKREFRIQYLPGLDQYRRDSGSPDETLSGWQNGVYSVKSVFRKEEKDWNMVYLAREEGSDTGHITWSIDLTESGMVADSVKLVLHTKVFESGKVSATVCGGDCCVKLPTDQPVVSIFTRALCGAATIKLSVDLSGGNGEVAWQHSQLFRAQLDGSEVGLDMTINLKPA